MKEVNRVCGLVAPERDPKSLVPRGGLFLLFSNSPCNFLL